MSPPCFEFRNGRASGKIWSRHRDGPSSPTARLRRTRDVQSIRARLSRSPRDRALFYPGGSPPGFGAVLEPRAVCDPALDFTARDAARSWACSARSTTDCTCSAATWADVSATATVHRRHGAAVLGCAWIATGTLGALYGGLALFLTGSGLNVTLHQHDADAALRPSTTAARRVPLEYAGMNIGFFVGFAVAGHFQSRGLPQPVLFARSAIPCDRRGRLQLEGAEGHRHARCCT